jgi:hypothetical protein
MSDILDWSILNMGEPRPFGTDRTCPKCRKKNALLAEATEEIHEQDQVTSNPQKTTERYSTTLYVTVSCTYCTFVGFTTLSKSVQGGSRTGKDGTTELWGAQDYPVIDPDDAIQIVVEKVKHPRHRWTAPW